MITVTLAIAGAVSFVVLRERRADARAGGLPAESGLATGQSDEPVKFPFTDMEAGKPPKGFSSARTGKGPEGTWVIEKEGDNQVLKQTSTDDTDFRFVVSVYDGSEYGDASVSVRFKAHSGEVDQAGGLVVRYKDAENYVLCRANALEGNFRVYTVKAGERKQLKTQRVTVAAGTWHKLSVECKGKKISCRLNEETPLEIEVEGFDRGKVGVWTKSDSVTSFDDLEITPAKAK
jgi:hypothetical protein